MLRSFGSTCRSSWKSPNHIDPTTTFTAFLIAVLVGARRFAHANLVTRRSGFACRCWACLAFLSMTPSAISSAVSAWATSSVSSTRWPSGRCNACRNAASGYSLDLDSTVFERYGQQEGSLKGHNPAQTRTPQSSSLAGGAGRSPLPAPRLAPQRQLRTSTWSGGVSQRSSRAVGTARKDPLAPS